MITKYDVEYMNVKCTGVDWENSLNNMFYFVKDGKTYAFIQKGYIGCGADTDHIRFVIEKQFLPWWKNQRINDLEKQVKK